MSLVGLINRFFTRREIVLFKSLRNCERRNKGNFTLKSNLNKVMLYGGGGQHYLVLKRFQRNSFISESLSNFISESNNILHVKGLFSC